jgi:hypothetical protein
VLPWWVARTINEKGAEWKFGREARPHFHCECWQKGCEQDISLSGKDWKLAGAKPNRFAVAPNHVAEDFEPVVTTYPHFWLVESSTRRVRSAEELATQTEVRPSPRDDRLALGGPSNSVTLTSERALQRYAQRTLLT